jgi:hypothetical protein
VHLPALPRKGLLSVPGLILEGTCRVCERPVSLTGKDAAAHLREPDGGLIHSFTCPDRERKNGRAMRITITVTVPEENISEESAGTDLTETAYDELVSMLSDSGYEDVSVSRGF